MSSNFWASRRARQRGWYRYCLRPRWSTPVAWMWPPGYGQIHTSSHAGGMTSSLIRWRTSGSSILSPSGSRETKPRPCLRRRRPGPVQSARRRRGVLLLDRGAAVAGTRAGCTRPPGGASARAREWARSALRRGLLGRRLALRRRLALALRLGGAVALAIAIVRATAAIALANGVEARLQRGHEVRHRLLGLLALRLHGDLLAGRLALDQREDLLAIGVAVLAGLPLAGERLDELLGDRQLAVVDLDLVRGIELVDALGIDDLVGEDHRGHPEDVALHGADRDEVLLLADHDLGDRDLAALAHRLEQQPVRLRATGPGREVVRVVVHDRVDVREVDEVLDLDGLRLLRIERLELARLDDHVAVRPDLEALDDVLVRDLVARRGVDALLLDAHARGPVELVKPDGFARHRAIELHRHGHQPEADGAGPDRACHGT